MIYPLTFLPQSIRITALICCLGLIPLVGQETTTSSPRERLLLSAPLPDPVQPTWE